MTVISTLISCIISALVAWLVAKRQVSTNFGLQEMKDYITIAAMEQKILDCKIEIEKENGGELKELHNTKLDVLDHQYHNIFEALCSRYLDNKIDKQNFKVMYEGYLRDLIDIDKSNQNKFYGEDSKYQKTIAVAKEFKILM